MPLHDPDRLSRKRIEEWKRDIAAGRPATAFALSVLDSQSPANERGEGEVQRQVLLTHCILDGHHRIQAATELGAPVRILALWSESHSLIVPEVARAVLERLGVVS